MNREDRKDLVERLRNVTEDDAYALPWTFGETCREAADEIDRLRRELEEARKALEPFAWGNDAMADILFGNYPDSQTMTLTIPIGAVRKANDLYLRMGGDKE